MIQLMKMMIVKNKIVKQLKHFYIFFSFPWLESASWVINTISQNMFTTRTRNHHDIQASLAWISHWYGSTLQDIINIFSHIITHIYIIIYWISLYGLYVYIYILWIIYIYIIIITYHILYISHICFVFFLSTYIYIYDHLQKWIVSDPKTWPW